MVDAKAETTILGTDIERFESISVKTSDETFDDEKLFLQAAAGDKKSFALLVEKYHAEVYRIAYRFFNSSEDAADVVQEVFLKAWRALPTFERRSSFKTWLLRIAANTCITLSQAKNRQKNSLLESIAGWFSQNPPQDPAERVIEREYQFELRQAVERNIARLPEPYRLAVILRDIEGRSLEQIAEILSVPVGTVKSRINRGRRLLQDALEPFLRNRRRQ